MHNSSFASLKKTHARSNNIKQKRHSSSAKLHVSDSQCDSSKISEASPLHEEHAIPEVARLFHAILKDTSSLVSMLGKFGGHTLRIPTRWPLRGKKDARELQELSKILTDEQMSEFVKYFAGTDVYIPKCSRYLCEVRNASIVKYFSRVTQKGTSSGDAVQKLARRHHLSDRRIWGILKTCVHEQK